jgi:hypothetical protein
LPFFSCVFVDGDVGISIRGQGMEIILDGKILNIKNKLPLGAMGPNSILYAGT